MDWEEQEPVPQHLEAPEAWGKSRKVCEAAVVGADC